MLSSLLGPQKGDKKRRVDSAVFNTSNPNTPSPGPANRREYLSPRHATADFTEADDDDEEESNEEEDEEDVGDLPRFTRYRPDGIGHDADRRRSSGTMIPLFSASHLDSLPVYSIVHAIRIIVQTRTETSLSWEQLRSPQVSQFLVKPMHQQIRTSHFSRATLYALMANCLQFAKEAQLYPGNAGTSNTRSKVCELLALKLMKEYSTRELIDALSFDFYPMQGVPDIPNKPRTPEGRNKPTAARTSTLEVAIRASAKHLLAHPLVVQQLEAIWNGAITFYSSADHLHRKPESPVENGSRTPNRDTADARTPLLRFTVVNSKEENGRLPLHAVPVRRTVALYDPRNASPLKLSRLRVPRYRQFFATCSLFILICLFLAVLVQRSSRITSLELVFWFWSAGFMLDEVVGFNEQGFSLYIMSFWNIFDLGILLLLVIYYCMRIYGMFLVEARSWNEMAYDVLAANAVLLLPRIFSVLDHYQYFSQLLIAFRLMAMDLAAVFILILISCSGFFVFFTLSRNNNDAAEVAYKIFQILMGFTPAAWEVWEDYNPLGKFLLVIFLIICHFVVVTILITVLTNSFMAIAHNANEEHQFLFAINTISMVKNDSLFSYVAPGNIIAWMLTPLRYVMPIRQFVKMNRTVIKLTHWPLLFGIFFYEKYFLASSIYEPTDLVDHQGRKPGHRLISFADPDARGALLSPNVRREESVVGHQKDQALEEVFRRPPDANTLRHQRRQERRKSQSAIRNWMDQSDDVEEPLSHWPTMDSRRSGGSRFARRFRQVSDVRSAASDPADLMSNHGFPLGGFAQSEGTPKGQQPEDKDQTDADGDDELVTNDEDEDEVATEDPRGPKSHQEEDEDYFTTPMAARLGMLPPSSLTSTRSSNPRTAHASPRAGPSKRQGLHGRTMSTNTILYAPQEIVKRVANLESESEGPVGKRSRPRSSRQTPAAAAATPVSSGGARSPRKTIYDMAPPARPRPIPSKTAPDRPPMLSAPNRRLRKPPSLDVDITSDMGLDPHHGDYGGVPSSFATQMAFATGQLKGLGRGAQEQESSDRMSRLVLARMKTLEESFADVVKEMRVFRSAVPTAQNSGDDGSLRGAAITFAGNDRRRAGGKKSKGSDRSRPGSVREDRVGMGMTGMKQRSQDKGKGKEIAHSSADSDDAKEARRIRRRGSSF
ncbi:integral membrane channel protein [Xylariales sp. AK1849]|nr:integral membrane channel protein [Xylariales sp. AK1849]